MYHVPYTCIIYAVTWSHLEVPLMLDHAKPPYLSSTSCLFHPCMLISPHTTLSSLLLSLFLDTRRKEASFIFLSLSLLLSFLVSLLNFLGRGICFLIPLSYFSSFYFLFCFHRRSVWAKIRSPCVAGSQRVMLVSNWCSAVEWDASAVGGIASANPQCKPHSPLPPPQESNTNLYKQT